jgi:hypothetical protein
MNADKINTIINTVIADLAAADSADRMFWANYNG